MNDAPTTPDQWTESAQRLIVRILARDSAGNRLRLIGGARYYLLDDGPRFSRDLDYDTEDDLYARQEAIAATLKVKLVRQLKERYGVDAIVDTIRGKEESHLVREVQVAFRVKDLPNPIVVDVQVLTIARLDGPESRAFEGTVVPTVSNADQVESKVIAIFNRVDLAYRDLVDLYLFQHHLHPDSANRLKQKFERLGIDKTTVARRLSDFRKDLEKHAKGIDRIVREELNPAEAQTLTDSGGGMAILQSVQAILETELHLWEGSEL